MLLRRRAPLAALVLLAASLPRRLWRGERGAGRDRYADELAGSTGCDAVCHRGRGDCNAHR